MAKKKGDVPKSDWVLSESQRNELTSYLDDESSDATGSPNRLYWVAEKILKFAEVDVETAATRDGTTEQLAAMILKLVPRVHDAIDQEDAALAAQEALGVGIFQGILLDRIDYGDEVVATRKIREKQMDSARKTNYPKLEQKRRILELDKQVQRDDPSLKAKEKRANAILSIDVNIGLKAETIRKLLPKL